MHTPMGYICQRRPLHAGQFFFVRRNLNSTKGAVTSTLENRTSWDKSEAEEEDIDTEDELVDHGDHLE
jgi:hypothetical protein